MEAFQQAASLPAQFLSFLPPQLAKSRPGCDRLEGEAHAQNPVVIEGVEAGDRNLLTRPHRQAQSPPKMNLADNQAGGKKHLLLAVVLTVVKENAIHFQFQP